MAKARPARSVVSEPHGAARKLDLWISLGLAITVFAVYIQVRGFEFIGYDDPEFVLHNLHLRGGLSPSSIAWAFRTTYAANWFPLTWLSYLLGVSLYGFDSGWHHFTNVILHALNSALLFGALKRMTGARWRSALVALLFAIHPLHVEPVAWIAERKELLSGLFWLLSICAYANYVRRPRPEAYLLLVLAFVCGVMSKPMIVTLPFLLLLLDFWPLRRWRVDTGRRLILEKAPLFAISAAASVITFVVQKGAGAISSAAEVPFPLRIENALVSYLGYISQFLWPARLSVLYPYAPGLAAWRVIGAAMALIAVTALVVFERKRRPYLFLGWFWFAGVLLPVIGLVQVGIQSRADRYLYIPLIGLAIMLVWGVEEIAERRAALRSAVVALATIVCCAYGVVAFSTAAYWRDTYTLFHHAIEVTENNWGALNLLSQSLLANNRVDDAMPYIVETLRLRPQLPDAHVNLAAALSRRGDFDAAEAQYRNALQLDPANPDAQEGLGVVQIEKGQLSDAVANLAAAEKSAPEDPDKRYNLGRAYGLAGRSDLAAKEFAETVRLQPENAEAQFNLGVAYAALERFPEAADRFREALRLKPDYAAALFNLGGTLANLGRLDEAIAQFQEVLRRQPDFPGAAQALEECQALKRSSQH